MSLDVRIAHFLYRWSLVPLLVLTGFYLYRSLSAPIHDFANSYFPASFFLAGDFDVSIFDPYLFNKKISDQGISGVFANFNPNPPSVAILFSPIAWLDVVKAKYVFSIVSLCLFLFSIKRLCTQLYMTSGWVYLILPFIFFVPIRNNILFGQSYFLVAFLLMEGFIAYENGVFWKSSVFWAFAVFLKVFPLFILIFLIFRKEYKQALSFVVVCVIFLALFVLIQGIDVWAFYFTKILPQGSSGELHSAFTITTQSAHQLFNYLFYPDAVFNPHPFISSPITFFVVSGICSALLVAFIIAASKIQSRWMAYTLVIIGTMLLSPQGSSYSLVLLLFICLGCFKIVSTKEFTILLILLCLTANFPALYFKELPVIFGFPRLLLLAFLFFTSLIYFHVSFSFKWFIFLLLIITTPTLVKYYNEKDESIRFIDAEKKPLIVGYNAQADTLYFDYWGDEGLKREMTNISVKTLEAKQVKIIDNDIFYKGNRLTHSSDMKLNATVLNDTCILYLSDKGKGKGFYAIRKITLP